jgi:type IV pilus assembly protein PilM
LSNRKASEGGLYRLGAVQRLLAWLDAMPHPTFVCEITPTHIAAARWGHGRLHLDQFAAEALPAGAVAPSPVETNIPRPEVVRGALRHVLTHVSARGQDVALLVPDPVVRVFILPFERFPRRADEAVPLLRWRLKKSVPFDVEETVVSAMRQSGRDGGLEVVAALARQKILREYESVIEGVGMNAGVVLSSMLATLPLIHDEGATLLARMSGTSLTTVIVRGETMCVYRSSEMSVDAGQLEPRALLDEIYPAVAYYQDTWGGGLGRVRLSGLGQRFEEFRQLVGAELGCAVLPLIGGPRSEQFPRDVLGMFERRLDALVGWNLNRGS